MLGAGLTHKLRTCRAAGRFAAPFAAPAPAAVSAPERVCKRAAAAGAPAPVWAGVLRLHLRGALTKQQWMPGVPLVSPLRAVKLARAHCTQGELAPRHRAAALDQSLHAVGSRYVAACAWRGNWSGAAARAGQGAGHSIERPIPAAGRHRPPAPSAGIPCCRAYPFDQLFRPTWTIHCCHIAQQEPTARSPPSSPAPGSRWAAAAIRAPSPTRMWRAPSCAATAGRSAPWAASLASTISRTTCPPCGTCGSASCPSGRVTAMRSVWRRSTGPRPRPVSDGTQATRPGSSVAAMQRRVLRRTLPRYRPAALIRRQRGLGATPGRAVDRPWGARRFAVGTWARHALAPRPLTTQPGTRTPRPRRRQVPLQVSVGPPPHAGGGGCAPA